MRQLSTNRFADAIRTRARLRDNFTDHNRDRDLPYCASAAARLGKNILHGRLMPPNGPRLSCGAELE